MRAVRYDVRVFADYGQYLITADVPVDPPVPAVGGNGVIKVELGQAVVYTGTHTGDVGLIIELGDSAPGRDTNGWDEVVEVTLTSPTGKIYARGLLDTIDWGDGADAPNLAIAGAGDYRLRVHVRGRDAGRDAGPVMEDQEPVEHHLIQIWAAEPGPEIVYMTGDQIGAYWRGDIPSVT